MNERRWGKAAAAVALAALSACATPAPEGALIADPFERVNRGVHSFNLAVDTAVVRPVTIAYDTVAPTLVQELLSNAVDHIRLPVDFANYLLQGEVQNALATAGRFGVNTIVGAAGLLDPATEFGLPYAPTDFGLTLASWGVEEGPFLMLPFFGPSTGRDAVGSVGDFAMSPFNFITIGAGSGETAVLVSRIVGPTIVLRDRNGALIDELFYGTEDSYVAVRSAYVQNRRAGASGGQVPIDSLPDVFGE